MPESTLKSYDFQISYGPADDRLNGFYIPALSCSVRYDRSAGYFSSTALAVAAAGVAHLLKNGGTMRLLVGAELIEADVAAVQKGHALAEVVKDHLLPLLDNPEEMARRRLEILAWLVAEGRLEIRVVLPCENGKPLSAARSRDYYHPKEGIFTDGGGERVAFSGSVNESAQGWEKNYEQFAVYKSWDASAPYLEQVRHRFENLWNGTEADWIALPIPEAVRRKLIRFRPEQAPERDPLEERDALSEWDPTANNGAIQQGVSPTLRERILFQFLRDAPFLFNGEGLGEATAPILLWPHQQVTTRELIEKFPARFLLCSEVGLGKTMEAGMALRQLLLSGKVKRCLILTPRSVARQWQEELYEKMGLNVPLYDGKTFTDYFHSPLPGDGGNPWAAHPMFIASSQLAKRREQQEELELDYDETAEEAGKLFAEEIAYVEDFLLEIGRLAGDSKWERLDAEIRELLRTHDTLVVFTHYTDTLDDLREKLRQVYGGQVACYSGRGGEIWNGWKWEARSKEQIKNAFREAKEVKILLCTDAASEGINLQTCGVLINYDMPWNPMRAEQRIGRIDRIGGHPDVYIRNYFYEDTVEARVYQALSRRIDWFEWIVGELQPILGGVERTIREIALTKKDARKTRLEAAIRQLEEEYERQKAEGFVLDDYLNREAPDRIDDGTPVKLADLERLLTQSESMKSLWGPHPEILGAWLIRWNDGDIPVTFNRELFDRFPETLRFPTYGEPLFEELVKSVPPMPGASSNLPLIRLSAQVPSPLAAWYTPGENNARPIATLRELEAILDAPQSTDRQAREFEEWAKKCFDTLIRESEEKEETSVRLVKQAARLALEERGRRLLMEAALCAIARSQHAPLFDQDSAMVGFDEDTLQRLRRKGYPFAPLFHLIETTGLRPDAADPFWAKISGKSEREIHGIEDAIRREMKELLKRLAEKNEISKQ